MVHINAERVEYMITLKDKRFNPRMISCELEKCINIFSIIFIFETPYISDMEAHEYSHHAIEIPETRHHHNPIEVFTFYAFLILKSNIEIGFRSHHGYLEPEGDFRILYLALQFFEYPATIHTPIFSKEDDRLTGSIIENISRYELISEIIRHAIHTIICHEMIFVDKKNFWIKSRSILMRKHRSNLER